MACGYITENGEYVEDTSKSSAPAMPIPTSPCGAAILNIQATIGENSKQESPVLHGGTLAGAN